MVLTAAYLVMRLALYLANTPNPLRFDLETTLFQATLPGLAEEFIYRGGVLAFMNAYFGSRPWQFARTPFGGGAVSTALLFGLAHALWFDSATISELDRQKIGRTNALTLFQLRR